MRTSPLVCATFLAVGCVGGILYSTTTFTSPAAPADAFECVRQQVRALGYTQTSIDLDGRRITARAFDETQRRPDVQFRRLVERLSVEVSPGATGETNLKVEGHTFAQMTLQRGPTEVEEKADDSVRGAAQAIVQECGK